MIDTRIEKIDAKKAKRYLDRLYDDQRNLSVAHVRKLAHTMKAGEWVLNGESIKFSKMGGTNGECLVDGQHRLAAIIESGESIQTVVMRGVEDESFLTLDQGKARTAADFIRHPHATLIAAAARKLYFYELCRSRGLEYRGRYSGPQDRPDNAELIHFIEQEHPGLIEASKHIGHDWAGLAKILALSTSIFCHYVFSNLDPDAADEFFEALASGSNLRTLDPIYKLREYLIADRMKPIQSPGHIKIALIFKAWNAHREGRDVRQLRWIERGRQAESFPKPI